MPLTRARSVGGRAAIGLLSTCLLALFWPGGDPRAAPGDAAEALYRRGLLPSGRALRGEREGGGSVEGVSAACATCHRRSGLGSWEGQTVIPPIIGRYLFRPGASNVQDVEAPHLQGYVPRREAYTPAALARAIREGVAPQGRKLSYLMPRYKLDDATMSSLATYLDRLTNGPVPGVTSDTLHFATVVTPDAEPRARQGMLDVLRQFFADKNGGHGGYRGVTPPLQSSRGVMYRVNRQWQLHVWELSGSPATWERQLQKHFAETPVFALISGIGGATWAPVHRFCEREAIPCLFPNVDLPIVAEQDFYSLYFSKGVLLEAELILRALDHASSPVRRVVQIFREGDIGEPAARALEAAMAKKGIASFSRALRAGDPGPEIAARLGGLKAGDAVVLWLRPEDLAQLPPAPAEVSAVYVSGLMGGMENAPLAPTWRSVSRLAYPLNLPALRKVNMNFPLGWFGVRHIPVVAERVQTDTYLACAILSETLGHMLDSFVRDYLVERVEVLLGHRLVNAHYPRLGLAPGQRFASKGGFIVHFAEPLGPRLLADGEWIVP